MDAPTEIMVQLKRVTAGIDVGSRSIKIVLMDPASRSITHHAVMDQGPGQEKRTFRLMERLLAETGLKIEDVCQSVATGYGRYAISFADKKITEITCHARGVLHLVPEVRTIIEIGGQDSKIIRLSEHGDVEDFSMNDRCAAGTGRFLEVLADRLDSDIESLDRVADQSARPAPINSMCVVFAETEITGLLAEGCPVEDIIAGVQESIARRISGMLGSDIVEPVIFTGGVARFSAMRKCMERIMGMKMETPEHPELTGALGAALIASERVENIAKKS